MVLGGYQGPYVCAPSDKAMKGSKDQSFCREGSVPSSAKQCSISGPLLERRVSLSHGGGGVKERIRGTPRGPRPALECGQERRRLFDSAIPRAGDLPGMVEVYDYNNGVLATMDMGRHFDGGQPGENWTAGRIRGV